MTWRPSTSTETAARFVDTISRRMRWERGRREHMRRLAAPRVARARLLREVMLEQLSGITPKPAAHLFQDVRDDYGTATEGQLEHALAILVREKLAARVDGGFVRAGRSS